jgi:hypothetical protein
MSILGLIFFLIVTLVAAGIRLRAGSKHLICLGLVAFGLSAGSLLLFWWLLDAAPSWGLIHEHPRFVRGVTAMPYGAFVGLLCGAVVLMVPGVGKNGKKKAQ